MQRFRGSAAVTPRTPCSVEPNGQDEHVAFGVLALFCPQGLRSAYRSLCRQLIPGVQLQLWRRRRRGRKNGSGSEEAGEEGRGAEAGTFNVGEVFGKPLWVSLRWEDFPRERKGLNSVWLRDTSSTLSSALLAPSSIPDGKAPPIRICALAVGCT